MRNLAKLQKDEHILGLTNVVFEKDRLCSACQAGKKVGAHHPAKNILSSSRPLKLLHMDLFGPIAYIRISGNKYGLVIVDDFFRFTWVFFLQDKSEEKGIVKKFIRRVQNEFELKVKNIRSDNSSEFRNTQVEEFPDEEGIKHELSAPYTPQQNGIIERKNRTLIEAARTMLDEYKTPDSFCEEFSRIMTKRFEMSMMGELKFFLGFQIKQMKEGTFLCQTKYVKDMLKRFDMADSKPIQTPMALNGHLDLNEEGKSVNQKVFRYMIGSLLYLCASRPDIMLSVCMCARFQANPKE
jgi:transposase InsO family protein